MCSSKGPAHDWMDHDWMDDVLDPMNDLILLHTVVNFSRPDLRPYANFYRTVHLHPELPGMEAQTAALVAFQLRNLGFQVQTGIGGHGVAGVFKNGDGKTVLMRAELDASPILEQTMLPYRSENRMTDTYGNVRPVMHACGHDMDMATLLAAAALLRSAGVKWSGTLVIIFQPGEEETGGAQAMVNDGLYNRVPVPDIMLGQHIVPLAAGKVAMSPGPVLVAADSANVRIRGGPFRLNPQLYVNPIALATRIIPRLEDAVRKEVGPEEYATVTCCRFLAGVPGNDYDATFLLEIKTIKPSVRERALAVIEKRIRDKCETAGMPQPPIVRFSTRAPLTENDQSVAEAIGRVFGFHFGDRAIEMKLTQACEDFATLGATHGVPYAYWHYGGSDLPEGAGPTNNSPFFAPVIQPTFQTATDAMALAALTFLVKE